MAQHAQIGDRFAAVGEHHRQIDGDPARLMDRASLPQPGQRITKPLAKPVTSATSASRRAPA